MFVCGASHVSENLVTGALRFTHIFKNHSSWARQAVLFSPVPSLRALAMTSVEMKDETKKDHHRQLATLSRLHGTSNKSSTCNAVQAATSNDLSDWTLSTQRSARHLIMTVTNSSSKNF